jgi:hypothetical protein
VDEVKGVVRRLIVEKIECCRCATAVGHCAISLAHHLTSTGGGHSLLNKVSLHASFVQLKAHRFMHTHTHMLHDCQEMIHATTACTHAHADTQCGICCLPHTSIDHLTVNVRSPHLYPSYHALWLVIFMHAWLGRLTAHACMLMCCVVPTDTVADRSRMRVIAFVALASTACWPRCRSLTHLESIGAQPYSRHVLFGSMRFTLCPV